MFVERAKICSQICAELHIHCLKSDEGVSTTLVDATSFQMLMYSQSFSVGPKIYDQIYQGRMNSELKHHCRTQLSITLYASHCQHSLPLSQLSSQVLPQFSVPAVVPLLLHHAVERVTPASHEYSSVDS